MMRYPEMMIAPMRQEVTQLGAVELRTPEAVDAFVSDNAERVSMVVINSVCGCSAGSLRPGLETLHDEGVLPDAFGTVFAGADVEATERVRALHAPVQPSSPAVVLFRDGKAIFVLQRGDIQGKPPEAVAGALRMQLDQQAQPAD